MEIKMHLGTFPTYMNIMDERKSSVSEPGEPSSALTPPAEEGVLRRPMGL